MKENFKEVLFKGHLTFSGDISKKIGTIQSSTEIENISFDLSLGIADVTYNSGDTYCGNIDKDFRRQGYGFYCFSSGASYKGLFNQNEFDGFGVFTYSNGDYYVGDFKSGVKHGFGRYIFADKIEFAGYFYHDLLSGIGKIRNSHANWEFCGVWNQGIREGKAIYKKNSEIFELFYEKNELKSVKKILRSS